MSDYPPVLGSHEEDESHNRRIERRWKEDDALRRQLLNARERGAMKEAAEVQQEINRRAGIGLSRRDREHDTFQTKFTATDQAGIRVSGVVCSGWFKGNTVRFD